MTRYCHGLVSHCSYSHSHATGLRSKLFGVTLHNSALQETFKPPSIHFTIGLVIYCMVFRFAVSCRYAYDCFLLIIIASTVIIIIITFFNIITIIPLNHLSCLNFHNFVSLSPSSTCLVEQS